jgi:hypothetical protein
MTFRNLMRIFASPDAATLDAIAETLNSLRFTPVPQSPAAHITLCVSCAAGQIGRIRRECEHLLSLWLEVVCDIEF